MLILLAGCMIYSAVLSGDDPVDEGADPLAADTGCSGEPSLSLLQGELGGGGGQILSDGDDLRITPTPMGWWVSMVDLSAQGVTPIVEVFLRLEAPAHGYVQESAYRLKLYDDGDCAQVTRLSDSLYIHHDTSAYGVTAPALLGCADLLLTGTLTDEAGQVVEETLRLVGACEEEDEAECGC